MARGVIVRRARVEDEGTLAEMISAFRVELARFRGWEQGPDLEAAREELSDFRRKDCPVFVAETEGKPVGYLVCRVEGDVVWAEQLYVLPEFRRRGIGSALYAEAEKLREGLGGETVYNWVHPNNDTIISFLAKRGYTVLNLIEIRRPWPGEVPARKIRVGTHVFDY